MACRIKLSSPTKAKANAGSFVVGNGNSIIQGGFHSKSASASADTNTNSSVSVSKLSKWRSAQGSGTHSSQAFTISVRSSTAISSTPSTSPNSTSASTLLDRKFSSEFTSFPSSQEDSFSTCTGTMAGDIRVVDGKKQRKLWTLHDRSMMSVHLVKANLAEEGCEEAQLDVAKKLLQDSQDAASTENTQSEYENARLAIYWLVKSSEQGNEEATRLLEECLSTGRGINSLNIFEVRTCINTPLNEKLTYKAARILYFKLNNEEKFITTTQLLARIQSGRKKVTFEEKEFESERLPPERSSCSNSNSNCQDNNGEPEEIPKSSFDLNETFTIQDEEGFDKESSNETSYGILNNSITSRQCQSIEYLLSQEEVKMSLEDLLKAAGSHNLGDIPEPNIDSRNRDLPRHRWPITSYGNAFVGQLLILAAITGAASLTKCILLGATFFGLWSAYNLILWKRRHSNFKDWTEAFRSALREGSWNEKENETRLSKKFLLPYLVVNFLSFLILSSSGSHGVIKLIVGSLSIATLLRSKLQSIPSWQTIFVVFAMIISSESVHSLLAGYEFEKYFTFGSEDMMKYVMDPLPQIPFGLPNKVVLQTAVGVIVASSLYWNTKLSVLQNVLPEMLCAIWTINLIPIPSQMNNMELVVGGFCCAFLITLFVLLERNIEGWKISGSFLAIILSVISLTVIMISMDVVGPNLLNSLGGQTEISGLKHIEWEDYDNDCHRTAWSTKSVAETQLHCYDKYSRESSTAVKWKGRIMLVKSYDISRFSNGAIQDVSFEITANILSSSTQPEKGWHFLQSDTTDIKAVVNILVSTRQFGPHRSLEKQKLIDYILSFRNGDKIEFHGILGEKTIGAIRPDIVDVTSVKCVTCFDADYAEFTLNSSSVADFAYNYWEVFRNYLKD